MMASMDCLTFYDALKASGVAVPEQVRRIVIDVQIDAPVAIYYDCYADKKLLDVVRTLDGVAIRAVDMEPEQV